MNLKDYQQQASRTIPDMARADLMSMGIIGLCGETGEVAELIKKSVYHGHELKKNDIAKELGDVLWYVSALCKAFNLNMDDVASMNIDKLKKRYPEGFSQERSIYRGEYKPNKSFMSKEGIDNLYRAVE